jgi:hypothetical protein
VALGAHTSGIIGTTIVRRLEIVLKA